MRKNIDKQYYKQGYKLIAGVDEAGRGAWAGPLVAAAVIMPQQPIILSIDDSKKITAKKRLTLYHVIMQTVINWSIVCITPAEIDKIGLHQANKLALIKAITNLPAQPDVVLVDGFKIENTQQIIHGDALSYNIAAASILAKVTRDRLLCMLHNQSGYYGFAQHKGYGTALHQKNLKKFGVSIWHRCSFAPIKRLEYTK
ncbi:MAG: ribonuclease HII [Patescibacteria group bacterium]|jgi:ribonuclease HII